MREIDWVKDCWTWPINFAQQTRTVNPFQQKIRHLHLFTLSLEYWNQLEFFGTFGGSWIAQQFAELIEHPTFK